MTASVGAVIAAPVLLDRSVLAQTGATITASQLAGKSRVAVGNLVGHGGPVHAVVLDGAQRRALTGSFDYSMILWDVSGAKPKLLKRFDGHDGPVKALAFLPDGKRALSGGDAGKLRLWDLQGNQSTAVLSGHQNKIVGIAISADGARAATASWDRTVRLWDLNAGKALTVLKGHTGPVQAVQFIDGGKRVVSASYDGSVRVWRLDGTQEGVVHNHGVGINALIVLPGKSNRVAFGALNGSAHVLDLKTSKLVHDFPRIDGPVLSMALQPKPGLLAIAGAGAKGRGGTLRIFRLGDFSGIETHNNPYGPIWATAFGKDGASLYYGGLDDFVTRWQVSPRKPFEVVESPFPRRFQVSSEVSLGERQFARKCSVCHTLKKDGRNRAGPTLYKLFGRKIGTVKGYPYSDALRGMDIVWTAETVGKLFSEGPDHYTPGSKMPLQQISDAKKRDALIAYLKVATDPEKIGAENYKGVKR